METRKERTAKKRAEWMRRVVHRVVSMYETSTTIKDPVERFAVSLRSGEKFIRYLIKTKPQEKTFYQDVWRESLLQIKSVLHVKEESNEMAIA